MAHLISCECALVSMIILFVVKRFLHPLYLFLMRRKSAISHSMLLFKVNAEMFVSSCQMLQNKSLCKIVCKSDQ
eukprot:6188981-Amphidinium_carterae.1